LIETPIAPPMSLSGGTLIGVAGIGISVVGLAPSLLNGRKAVI